MPDRLSALDASFLSLERGELPMHIAALMVFEGPVFKLWRKIVCQKGTHEMTLTVPALNAYP